MTIFIWALEKKSIEYHRQLGGILTKQNNQHVRIEKKISLVIYSSSLIKAMKTQGFHKVPLAETLAKQGGWPSRPGSSLGENVKLFCQDSAQKCYYDILVLCLFSIVCCVL